MNESASICLIGDIIIDVIPKTNDSEIKLRLGGVVHAARALWALNIPYDVGYFSPAFMDIQVTEYLNHHGCVRALKLGNVIGSPNVMLIQDAKEAGNQGYEYLLKDEHTLHYDHKQIANISNNAYSHTLLISGKYDVVSIVNLLTGSIHVDLANDFQTLNPLSQLTKKIDTIFLSTSSEMFLRGFQNEINDLITTFEPYCDELVLKENRGGSRSYDYETKSLCHIKAQPRKISHSVGVGDCFDAAYVSGIFTEQLEKGVFSSWVAAEYAVTSFPDDFKTGVSRVRKSDIKELLKMPGVSLPWEDRKRANIYIAGPDFTFVDTHQIDILAASLRYHNFTPRRPIKENGQMEEDASKARRIELVTRDIQILAECLLLVAVLLYDDPGTLIEIGYAKARGIPTIVFDPYKIAKNCMLTELPDLLSPDLDEVITEVFIKTANHFSNGK